MDDAADREHPSASGRLAGLRREAARLRLGGTRLPGRLGLWLRVSEMFLAVLLGILIVRLIYAVITPLPQPQLSVPPVERASGTDISIFSRFDPFTGNRPGAEIVPVVEEQVVTETKLDLTLMGTFVDGDRSSAIVKPRSGQQTLYALGDKVPGGATIEGIERDRILLARGGEIEALRLENRDADVTAPPIRQASRQTNQQASQPAPSLPEDFEIPDGPTSTATSPGFAGGVDLPFDPTNAEAFGALTSLVRPRPDPTTGTIALYPGENAAWFAEQGLIEGDQLVSVGGRPVTGPMDYGALATELQSGSLQVTVERDGVPITLNVSSAGMVP